MTKRATTKTSGDTSLDEIIRLVPGYDPAATAGDCRFEPEAALRAIGFFEDCLVHIKGKWAGQPFLLEPWQKAILANLFGWKRPDGTRRYREAFIFVPRKNGKSLLAAGICCYMLFCDDEWGAEIYSAAAERDQAALVFEVAKQMVRAEPVLAEVARIYTKSITIEQRGSSYKAISADASTKHGYNTHCAVIDELHAQRNRELVDVLATSTGARAQPLIVHITTSDFERISICNEKHGYASKVRDGIIEDPAFLPVIYEATRDDDWTDPATWRKANPNLGVSISEDYLAQECKRAQESPAFENTFKRLHLNIRTEQDVRWLSMERWDRCGGDVRPDWLVGERCWGGLDLGATADLTSLCLLFPDEKAEGYKALWWFWAPRDNAERRERRDRVPYLAWEKQGFLELTDGEETDYRVIRRRVGEIVERYRIVDLAVDRLFQGAELCQNLADDGIEVVPFGQGFMSMAAPAAEFERLVNRGELRHGDNPVMRWMASNATVRMDPAGNIKPDKQRSREKIDGVVAAVMALGRAIVREEEVKSVYQTRGVRWLG